MPEYNSPEEYIAEVQKHIRWKRAKVIATRELAEHINDQYDVFIDNGLDKQQAMKRAILEMGSADVVGAELDGVHRPKTNWLLLGLTGSLLVIGLLVSSMLLSADAAIPKIFSIAFGLCAAIFLYFIDYTILIRFPRLLYGVLSSITLLTLIWELRNGFDVLGYSYTFYLLLYYPIVLIGILFYIKNSGNNIGIFVYMIYAAFPLVLALLDKAFTIFIVLLICECFILTYGLKLKWVKWNKANIIGTVCILFSLALLVFFMNDFYGLMSKNTTSFYQMNLFSVLRHAEFVGKSSMAADEIIPSYLYDHPTTLLLYYYGILSVVLLLMVFGILFYLLYKATKKQDTEPGKLLANIVLLIFVLKIVGTILSDIGVIPNFFMCFPFVVTGGVYIIYDLSLIGIILSINRNESIAKDWIKLKNKRRIENE